MLKQFFKDGVIYSIPQFLSRGIGLILVPFYTKVLIPTEYGIIDIMSVVASLAFLTVALEISQAIARFYPEVEDLNERKIYASTALIFTIACFFTFGFLMLLFSDYLGNKILADEFYKLLYFIAITQIVIDGVAQFLMNQLRFQLLPKEYAIVSTIKLVVVATVAIYLVLILRIGVIGTFYAALSGSLSAVILSYLFSYKSYKLTFSRSKLLSLLKFSIPIIPSSVAVFLSLFTDRIMIKEMLGLNELGLYGIAFRFGSIMILIVSGFRTALTPLIYSNYKSESTKKDLSVLLNIFLFFSSSVVCFFFLFPKEVLLYLTSAEYLEAWPIIGFLCLSIMLSNLYLFTPGASIAKKTVHILIANVMGALFNALLNYYLIPIMGILGAAISTMLSALIAFMYYYFSSQRFYKISFENKRIKIAFSILAVFSICSIIVNQAYDVNINLMIIKAICFFIYMAITLIVLIKNWKFYLNKISEGHRS